MWQYIPCTTLVATVQQEHLLRTTFLRDDKMHICCYGNIQLFIGTAVIINIIRLWWFSVCARCITWQGSHILVHSVSTTDLIEKPFFFNTYWLLTIHILNFTFYSCFISLCYWSFTREGDVLCILICTIKVFKPKVSLPALQRV